MLIDEAAVHARIYFTGKTCYYKMRKAWNKIRWTQKKKYDTIK